MGKLLPNGGNVGVIISPPSLTCHQERLQGFKDSPGKNCFNFVLGQYPANQGYLIVKTLFEYLMKNIRRAHFIGAL